MQSIFFRRRKIKKIANIIIGFIPGIIVIATTVRRIMPGMMITERQSFNSVEETAEKTTANVQVEGWVISSVRPLHWSVKKHAWTCQL